MFDSTVKSIYVIQTQVVGLDGHPFPQANILRPSWQPIFCNLRCFADQRQLIRDASWLFRNAWRTEKGLPEEDNDDNDFEDGCSQFTLPLPSLPFIRGLGSICFNTRRIHARTYFERGDLALKLWDQGKKENVDQDIDGEDYNSAWLLGYDRNVQDQRMNHLCFELAHPLSLHAQTHNDIQANGKLFIHIYPSGYIVFHLAVSLVWEEARSLSSVREILRELRPHHLNATWTWTSRLGKQNETLNSLINKIYKQVEVSLFNNPDSRLRTGGQWRSFLRVSMEKCDPFQVSSVLLGCHDKPKIIKDLSVPSSRSGAECLIITRQGAACIFRPFSIQHEELRNKYTQRLSSLFDRVRAQVEITPLSAKIRDDIQSTILNSKLFGLKDQPHAKIAHRLRREDFNLTWELREKDRNGTISTTEREHYLKLADLEERIRDIELLVSEMHHSWSKPQAARRFFWKMSRIHEFVLVKEIIYEDYSRFIQDQVHQLQKFRRSLILKITEEDLFKFSVFDQQAADYLQVLDRHIAQTNNFYRFIYSVLCQGTRVDDLRSKVRELIKEWDNEARTWEHPAYAAWKRIVQPLRAFLK